MFSVKTILLINFSVLIISCQKVEKNKELAISIYSDPLFTIVSSETSNIYFENILKESLTMNGLFYEYFYNGAGVAVGDLNGDDLTDIYFISNLKSNKLYLNQGNLKFQDVTTMSKVKGKYGFPTGVTMVDINADGLDDFYVGGAKGFNGEIYAQTNIGTFNKLSNKTWKKDALYEDIGASFFDTDLDLYVVSGGNEYDEFSIELQDRLYLNDGLGNFIKSVSSLPKMITSSSIVEPCDFDSDGDIDLIVGNLGKNYKYKASFETPFEVHSTDFDNNGTLDIVLSYYESGNKHPLRDRSCSSQQIPSIKNKFPTYKDFGLAILNEVYGDILKSSLHYTATTFSTSYIENLGDKGFKITPLPNLAQISSVNGILIQDYNNDGNKDVLIAGNLYGSEIETPRNDAGYGLLLTGNGKGEFTAMPADQSGLYLKGDVKT